MIGKLNERGITLVALVVTIIIILILAGVTISQITGDNGLIKRTTQAKEEYEKESLKEEIRLAVLDKRLEKNGELSDSDLEGILKKYGTVEGTGKEMKLTPTGTSYEITYEDIMNGETTSDTAGGDSSGSGSSEDSQEKIEVSKEEFTNMKESLTALQERVNAIDGGQKATLTLDQAYNKNPKIHSINVVQDYTTKSNDLEDTGVHFVVPKNCFYSLCFTINQGAARPEKLLVREDWSNSGR